MKIHHINRQLSNKACPTSNVPNTSWSCPHCGSKSGTWFDRSVMLDHQGNPHKYEEFPNRCNCCGKNVDAPKDYYKQQTRKNATCKVMKNTIRQDQEIIQKINSCNTEINMHKKEIAKLDAKIDSLLSELQKLESKKNSNEAQIARNAS